MKKTISEGPRGLLDFYSLPDCTPAPHPGTRYCLPLSLAFQLTLPALLPSHSWEDQLLQAETCQTKTNKSRPLSCTVGHEGEDSITVPHTME